MDIAALSMNLSAYSIGTEIQTRVLKMAMDSCEQNAEAITLMLAKVQQPHLGQKIDVSA